MRLQSTALMLTIATNPDLTDSFFFLNPYYVTTSFCSVRISITKIRFCLGQLDANQVVKCTT